MTISVQQPCALGLVRQTVRPGKPCGPEGLDMLTCASVQDLGCGDAGPIAKLVSAAAEQGRPLVHKYTGVDLSKPALSLAQANMARCSPCSCK